MAPPDWQGSAAGGYSRHRTHRATGDRAVKITEGESFFLRLPDIQERTDSSQDAFLIRVLPFSVLDSQPDCDGIL
jgi:hypothetical protein